MQESPCFSCGENVKSIRNGAYMNTDGSFKHDFFEMVDGYEKRLQYDSKNTELPDNPDFEQVQELVMTINAMTLGIAELPVQWDGMYSNGVPL